MKNLNYRFLDWRLAYLTVSKWPIAGLLILITNGLMAQDFEQLIRQSYLRFEDAENLELKVVVKVFDDQSDKPLQEQNIQIKKRGKEFFYVLDDISMLLNDRYLITVDHQNRTLSYKTRSVDEVITENPLAKLNMDSVLNLVEDPELVRKSGDILQFIMQQKTGEIKTLNVWVDQSVPRITSLSYYYKSRDSKADYRVKIDYPLLNNNPVFDRKVFSEKQFLTREGDSFVPAQKYRDYSVLNYDLNN